MINDYCSKCGRRLNPNWLSECVEQEGEPIELTTGKVFIPKELVTKCCLAKPWHTWEMLWDTDGKPVRGERYCSRNLDEMVQLCLTIGKSLNSIVRGGDGFYIEVKSPIHKDKLEKAFQKELPTSGVVEEVDDGNTGSFKKNKKEKHRRQLGSSPAVGYLE